MIRVSAKKDVLRLILVLLSVSQELSFVLLSCMAYFNGLVLPHCDYADIVWGRPTWFKIGNGTIAGIP